MPESTVNAERTIIVYMPSEAAGLLVHSVGEITVLKIGFKNARRHLAQAIVAKPITSWTYIWLYEESRRFLCMANQGNNRCSYFMSISYKIIVKIEKYFESVNIDKKFVL